ncbi:MAG: guanylate kinase [Beijerinckiaceae bacterium]|jgi:guanylate kinase|nr:guanylate kinase [Beijerinckiaceae bacterium]
MTAIPRRGLMLILSSPSGAGKSTLTRQLVEDQPDVRLSVSVTTRPKRASEIDGKHYRFITVDEFKALQQRGDLLESAEVHGNFYGTPRKPVETALAAGRDVLFDIDWQGTRQIMAKMRKDVVAVFVLPPSMAELKMRLERRAEDAPETISKRLRNARDEIAQWGLYDYLIVNDDLGRAFSGVQAILAAERLKRERLVGAKGFLDTLLGAPDA